MKHDGALKKKLRYWQNRIALTKALIAFLKRHPVVASHTINWSLSMKRRLFNWLLMQENSGWRKLRTTSSNMV
jgi:hypothetical protein